MVATSTSVLSVTPAGFEAFSKMADSIAMQVTDEKHRGKLVPARPSRTRRPMTPAPAQILKSLRPVAVPPAVDRRRTQGAVDLARTMTKSSGDFYTGLRYGLASSLQSPDFLFRSEMAVRGGNKLTLDPYSRATRLSYLMWDTTPDGELLRAAKSGELNTDAGLAKQVDRLDGFAAAGNRHARLLQRHAGSWTPSTPSPRMPYLSEVGRGMAPSAKEETLRTVIDLALRENGDMRDLMTTRKTFLNRSLAAVYERRLHLQRRLDGV